MANKRDSNGDNVFPLLLKCVCGGGGGGGDARNVLPRF